MSTIRNIICLALLLAGPRVPAQDAEPAIDPETGLLRSIGELVLEADELEAGWLELTPLASDAPPWLQRLGDRTPEDGELRLAPEVPQGAAMLCAGAGGVGVLCEQVYFQGEAWVERGESVAVAVRFEPGLMVRGRYLQDGFPVAGARVAVVPAGLAIDRPFTMPLGVELSRSQAPVARREIEGDGEGRFELPPLAAGVYFLETLLPSGRVHRGEPFELPDPGELGRSTGAGTGDTLVWDLGEIDVTDGLVVAFEVADPLGEPISGARVAGRQGRTPESLVNYEVFTDDAGAASLSGFSAEEAVHLSCRKPGYRSLEQDYPLLPVLITCVLEPLAAVRGEVLGIEGLALPGARVSLEPIAIPAVTMAPPAGIEAPAAAPEAPPAVQVDVEGAFAAGDLAAGDYRLRAAAPGYEVETRDLTLEPGQRLELETLVLLRGRALTGQVLDEETREPIAGAEIRATSPLGAAYEVTGEDGGFILATRTRETLVLRLRAEDYAGREVTVTPERLAEREPLVLTMKRGGRIQAVVWDEATGLPCQSCRLVVKVVSLELRMTLERAAPSETPAPPPMELITGAGGEALSETLAPGRYRVSRPRISHRGSTVVTEDDAEVRRVRVRRGETATVRFGERRREVRVVFRPSPGGDSSLSASTPSRTERYRQEPGGGFQVRHRAGESLELFLHRWQPEAGAEVEVRQATLPADVTAGEWVVPLTGARLSGRATHDGGPLPGARVRLRTLDAALHATALTDSDGSFTIPHLPAGVYTVFIGERAAHFASVRPGQSLDLGTFDLSKGGF